MEKSYKNNYTDKYKSKLNLIIKSYGARTLEHIITSCNRQIESFERSFGGVVTMKDNFFATSSTNFS